MAANEVVWHADQGAGIDVDKVGLYTTDKDQCFHLAVSEQSDNNEGLRTRGRRRRRYKKEEPKTTGDEREEKVGGSHATPALSAAETFDFELSCVKGATGWKEADCDKADNQVHVTHPWIPRDNAVEVLRDDSGESNCINDDQLPAIHPSTQITGASEPSEARILQSSAFLASTPELQLEKCKNLILNALVPKARVLGSQSVTQGEKWDLTFRLERLFTYGVKASQCRRARSHRNKEAGWLLKESVDRAIWDALGTIATDKQQPPKAHEEEKKKKKFKKKKKDKKLTPSRHSGSDTTVVSALTHVLAHTRAQDLDAALASRVSVLGLICLVERGLTPMFLSLWLNAVRASGCLNALFAASEMPDSTHQEITPLPVHEDCQVIAACLNRSLSDIFRGHTRAVKPKCIVTFLDVTSPALPFLPILRDPVSQLYVQRLLNGLGGVAEAKAGGALGAYLRGPLSL